MTQLLTMMATPAWAYLALYGLLAADALVPVVPTQAIMITSGALTVYGRLSLPIVIVVGGLGMLTGDSICYVLGRTAGHGSGPGLKGRLAALRRRCAPGHDRADGPSGTHQGSAKRAAARFTRGLRRSGPLVLLLCRFVPGGRMAAGYHAGRTRYPVRLFLLYDGFAAFAWATYGGLVGHLGGTALTQSAWKLFAVAATAAVVFGTAGWILALFGGRHDGDEELAADAGAPEPAAARPEPDSRHGRGPDGGNGPEPDRRNAPEPGAGGDRPTATRAASAGGPPRRSNPTATDRS